MEKIDAFAEDVPFSITRFVLSHPFLIASALFSVICIFTRIKTGRQAKYQNEEGSDISHPRAVPVVPYWVPGLAHTLQFGLTFQDYMKKIGFATPTGIFSLRVAGTTHNIIVSPSLAKEVLMRTGLPTTNDKMVFYFFKSFFNDHGSIEEVATRDPEAIWDHAHRAISLLQREPFLSRAIANTVKAIEDRTWNFISGNTSWVDQSLPERAGRVEIISKDESGDFVAEANLFALTREYVGEIASELLMGHSFLENNPGILQDLWNFDSKFNTFMLGLPAWLVPGLTPADVSRERLITAIGEHADAMANVLDGKDPGYKYDDLSDCANVLWERLKALRAAKCTFRAYSTAQLSLLWAMNVNANQVIFWMAFYIFADKTLLADIREEIKPHVKSRQAPPNGLRFSEALKLDIDIVALVNKCPLLKSSFMETMRLEVGSVSYKIITDDFVISESAEDAHIVGQKRAESYVLRKGEWVCVPHGVHQDDSRHWKNPAKFDPRRFWITEPDAEKEKSEGPNVTVDYKTMKVWGGGKTMCKGRNFAEREVLAFVAGIVALWEMEPVDKKMLNADGTFKHPGRKFGGGTTWPKKDVRMKMRRRKDL